MMLESSFFLRETKNFFEKRDSALVYALKVSKKRGETCLKPHFWGVFTFCIFCFLLLFFFDPVVCGKNPEMPKSAIFFEEKQVFFVSRLVDVSKMSKNDKFESFAPSKSTFKRSEMK